MDQSTSAERERDARERPDSRLDAATVGAGPYPAIVEGDPTLPTHTIYRPQDLAAFGASARLPVVAWGNGGCANSSLPFRPFLLEIASHGVLVVALGAARELENEPVFSSTEASELLDAIDWALAEHARTASRYAGKLATGKIAVMGQSCGGLQALAVSPDPRITTTVVWNSGVLNTPPPPHIKVPAVEKSVLAQLHAPIAYFVGGVEDIAYANALDDVTRIAGVPLFFGSIDVGHGGTFAEPRGGVFGRVGVAWLRWRLMDDRAAGALFIGADGLRADPRWQVITKHLS